MYDGWFCFGGTEIINDARSVGYARTASQIRNFDVAPIPGSEAIVAATNRMTNPSAEAGGAAVEVYRNAAPAPRAEVGPWLAQAGTGGVATTTVTNIGVGGAPVMQMTWTTAATAGVPRIYMGGTVPARAAVVGSSVTPWSVDVSAVGSQVQIAADFYTAGGVFVSSAVLTSLQAVSTSAATPTRIAGTAAVPATAAFMILDVRIPAASALVGTVLRASRLAIGLPGSMYADGGVSPDTDMTASWVGAVNLSPSILSGISVAGVTPTNCVAIRSTQWVKNGSYSMRVIPTTASTSSRVQVTIPAGTIQDDGVVLGTVRLAAPLTGVLNAAARTIRAQLPVQQSAIAPNVAGETDLRLAFSDLTSSYTAQFWHGGSVGAGDVWWDAMGLIDGPYGGGVFDGNTPDQDGLVYRWLGVENASESVMEIPATPATPIYYCDVNWFTYGEEECHERLRSALQHDVPYEAGRIPDDAPWFSQASGYNYASSPSRRFLGVHALSVSALSDSTRAVDITEGILSGGVLGRERLAVPRFRFRVMLTAVDEDGLEYGMTWLSKALSEQSCSTHGASCGSSDLTFFTMCPPTYDPDGPEAAYEEKLDAISRMYHDVKCIQGPVETDRFNRPENTWGMIVEFTLAAGVASMFGLPAPFEEISREGQAIIQDIPLNMIPYPSAEIAGADVTVATNYSLNPSVETNATGWAAAADGVNITAGMLTSGRVTGELQAVGTSSFRVVFTATGAGANGTFSAQQEVDLSARPAGSRVSMNYWAAELLMAGAPVRADIEFTAIWRATSGGAALRTDVLGTAPVLGGFTSARSIEPPVGANFVLIRAQARLTSWPAGTILRLYADALAVTVP